MLIDTLISVVPVDPGAALALEHRIVPLAVAAFVKFGNDPFLSDAVTDLVDVIASTPGMLESLHVRCLPTVASVLRQHANEVCWCGGLARGEIFFPSCSPPILFESCKN